MKALELHHH